MPPQIIYDRLRPGEEHLAAEMVLSVFDKHVAPEFSAQGIEEFRRYATSEALRSRLDQGAVIFVGRWGEHLIGLAEVRDHTHLALLFVDSATQGRGVGKALLGMVTDLCRAHGGEGLTVNASPNSRGFYQRMGFEAQGEETLKNGIRFIPMRLSWNVG